MIQLACFPSDEVPDRLSLGTGAMLQQHPKTSHQAKKNIPLDNWDPSSSPLSPDGALNRRPDTGFVHRPGERVPSPR